eukprot:CAMPEP_0174831264 /NCGR_PEP_ID=MMETSP1114-20130205/2998_1 /TAXON_ID=312471 /ORGANISM="Neobodo designis, Strain CCAP 1951/1" /LENGTH=325 /DNA_ID=CAMNT_0016065085 /DNA_START=47 /DNA_END=1024 /DNA_ORIENTATION=-
MGRPNSPPPPADPSHSRADDGCDTHPPDAPISLDQHPEPLLRPLGVPLLVPPELPTAGECHLTRSQLQRQLELCAHGANEALFRCYFNPNPGGVPLCLWCHRAVDDHHNAENVPSADARTTASNWSLPHHMKTLADGSHYFRNVRVRRNVCYVLLMLFALAAVACLVAFKARDSPELCACAALTVLFICGLPAGILLRRSSITQLTFYQEFDESGCCRRMVHVWHVWRYRWLWPSEWTMSIDGVENVWVADEKVERARTMMMRLIRPDGSPMHVALAYNVPIAYATRNVARWLHFLDRLPAEQTAAPAHDGAIECPVVVPAHMPL